MQVDIDSIGFIFCSLGAKRLTDLSRDRELMARSRRTSAMRILPMPLGDFQPRKTNRAAPLRSGLGNDYSEKMDA